MNLNPTSGIPIALGLCACLLGAVGLAALTRPIDRERLPRDPSEVLGELAALHRGDGPCARWPHGDRQVPVEDLTSDLARQGFHADLHIALPLLSAIRVANYDYEAGRHADPAPDEFRQTALEVLGRMDRLRLRSGRQDPEALVPALQSFADEQLRLERDRRRVFAFESTLPDDHLARFRALAAGWRVTLAHPRAQASVLDRIAKDITQARIAALQSLLAEHNARTGQYPLAFKELLERVDPLPEVVRRGIERDGSLRDGWLRPFEYYRVGYGSYRLRSQGSDPDTEDDDVLAHPAFNGRP